MVTSPKMSEKISSVKKIPSKETQLKEGFKGFMYILSPNDFPLKPYATTNCFNHACLRSFHWAVCHHPALLQWHYWVSCFLSVYIRIQDYNMYIGHTHSADHSMTFVATNPRLIQCSCVVITVKDSTEQTFMFWISHNMVESPNWDPLHDRFIIR